MLKSTRTGHRAVSPRRPRGAGRALFGAIAVTALLPVAADGVTKTAGDRSFEVDSIAVQNEGYQIAHSEAGNALWVTGTSHQRDLGFPQAAESALTKVAPDLSSVLDTITPPTLPEERDGNGNVVRSARPDAVYGVGVDEENNRIWVSLTREDSIAVYDATTKELVERIPNVGHTRDIKIDPHSEFAYVSMPQGSPMNPSLGPGLLKIDKNTFEVVAHIDLGNGFSPMSLDLVSDGTVSLLYTTNLSNGNVIELDNHAEDFRVIAEGVGTDASGVAVDRANNRIYVGSQGGKHLRTLDLTTGEEINTAAASAAVLNVAVDPEEGLVYAAVFGSNTILVADATTGARIGEFTLGTSPNDVIVVNGTAYAIDRSVSGAGQKSQLWRIVPTEGDGGGNPDPDPDPEQPAPAAAEVIGSPTIGGQFVLRGTGWKHPSNGGSTIAIKLDDGQIQKDGSFDGVWTTIEANADGTFEATIQLPDGTTGPNGSTVPFTEGPHWLRLLTGSLKPGDQGRSVRVDIAVGPATTPPPPDPGTGTPGTGDPGTGTPGGGNPGTTNPGTGTPGGTKPGTGTPGAGTPSGGGMPAPNADQNSGNVVLGLPKALSSSRRANLRVVVHGKNATGAVLVKVDNKRVKYSRMKNVNAKRGLIDVRLPLLKPGRHTISVIYSGSASTPRATATKTVVVRRSSGTKVAIGTKGTATSRSATARIVVHGKRPTGAVLVRIGGKRVAYTQLKNVNAKRGLVDVKLPRLSAGRHTVSVIYSGNAANDRSVGTSTIRVSR